MPELPEVETVLRGLHPLIVGRRFEQIDQRRPDLRFPFPADLAERLFGAAIVSLSRRAKYLIASTDRDDDLVMHLGMTGRFTVSFKIPADSHHTATGAIGQFAHTTGTAAAHDHIVFHLSDGVVVTYNDPRRFGFILITPTRERAAHPLFRDLGIEPLGSDLTPSYLARRALNKAVSLKAFLMDQSIIAGLGNIYASEALFRAGLSPRRSAATLARANGDPAIRAERLEQAIRSVLHDAIAAGGSTLQDYRHADGGSGSFQSAFDVYGREGKHCRRVGCDGTIIRIVQTGRASFACAKCQH